MTLHKPNEESVTLPKWASPVLLGALLAFCGWLFGYYNQGLKNDTALELRMTASEKDRTEIHEELRQLNGSILEITKSNARSEEDLKQLATGEIEIKTLMQEHMVGEETNWTKHAGKK
jgi:hypothetical protein